jgi:hypothetical protein
MDVEILGSSEPGVKVWGVAPEIEKLMVSVPEPAAHSPPAAPEAVSELAAVIASLRLHTPSLAAVSVVPLTVMVAALAAFGISSTRTHKAVQCKARLSKFLGIFFILKLPMFYGYIIAKTAYIW